MTTLTITLKLSPVQANILQRFIDKSIAETYSLFTVSTLDPRIGLKECNILYDELCQLRAIRSHLTGGD